MNGALQSLKKDNRGISTLIIAAGALLLTVVILSAILAYAQIYSGLNNIKNKVKLELNNTSASASEMIYGDIGEQNNTSYLETFHRHESELKRSFFSNLKMSLSMETENYIVDADSMELTFEAKEDYIKYKFKCRADIRIYYFGVPLILENQEVNVSARHSFKGNDSDDTVTNYEYIPSQKQENTLH